MNFIASYFNKPFPIVKLPSQKLIISFLFGLFVFLFLLIFQPFDIDKVIGNLIMYSLGFGTITLTVMVICFFVGPILFKSFFDSDEWNIGKNLVFIIAILAFISILNWMFHNYININNTVQHSLFRFVLITVAIGITPIAFLMFFIENKLNETNTTIAKSVSAQIQNLPHQIESSQIIIKGENKNEELILLLNELICVKSEGNYVLVYYKFHDTIKKAIMRNSISSIEKQLGHFETIYRCHRSYIVNLENVIEVIGNARNFNLLVNGLEFNIPVSRSFPKSVLTSIAL